MMINCERCVLIMHKVENFLGWGIHILKGVVERTQLQMRRRVWIYIVLIFIEGVRHEGSAISHLNILALALSVVRANGL